MQEVATFCRICEPSCGLIAEVDGDEIQRLKPDKKHPVTRGFACHKGLGFDRIHRDPDRVNAPLVKDKNGFAETSWENALAGIAAKLNALIAAYGPNSVGLYIGNPTAFSATAPAALLGFAKALGLQRQFNSGTQDCSNKFAGSEAVFGTSTLHPVPDLEHADCILILGENPGVSQMSFVSQPDPVGTLRAARKRGAKVRFVNPRRIEPVNEDCELLQIYPDTDLYLLAALLHEMDAAGLFDNSVIEKHGRHIEGLRAFIQPYTADAVASVCGVAADQIRELALEFGQAKRACVHMSTGLNMGRQGTLCYWLVQMLSFCTGNLDVQGGNLYGEGFFPATRAGRIDLTQSPFTDSRHGQLRTIRGALPGNLLADMILDDPEPIRALLVVAGNPVLSVGGEARMREALSALDLLVTVDLYRNATGELADYVLPACDMLERADVNLCGLGMQTQPFVQYSGAVVPARGERREEWWIMAELLRHMGYGEGAKPEQAMGRINHMLSASNLDIKALTERQSGTAVLPPPAAGQFYEKWIQTADQKVDCCPPLFENAIEKAHGIFEQERRRPKDELRLISLRTRYMHNSWLHNDAQLKRAKQQANPLHIHPSDAQLRGLAEGDSVRVHNANGAIKAEVRFDEALRPGVVAMTHGWGNQRTPGMSTAQKFPGVNVNVLLPQGAGSYEALSNQAHMTGIPVQLEAAA